MTIRKYFKSIAGIAVSICLIFSAYLSSSALSGLVEFGWTIQNNNQNIAISYEGNQTVFNFKSSYDWSTGELAKFKNKLVSCGENAYEIKFKVDDLSGGWSAFSLSWDASSNGILNNNGLIFIATAAGLEIRNAAATVTTLPLNVMEFHEIITWYSGTTIYVSVDGTQAASFVNADIANQYSSAIALGTGLTVSCSGGNNTAFRINADNNSHGWEKAGSRKNIAIIDNEKEMIFRFGNNYNWQSEHVKWENKLVSQGNQTYEFKFKVDNLTGGWIPFAVSWSVGTNGVLNANGIVFNAINGALEIRNAATMVATVPMDVTVYHDIKIWYSANTVYIAVDGTLAASFVSSDIVSQLSGAINMSTGLTLSVGGGNNTAIRIKTDLFNNGWSIQNSANNIGITDTPDTTTIAFGQGYNWETGELAKLENKVLPLTDNRFSFTFKLDDITGGWVPIGLSWSASANGTLHVNGLILNACENLIEIKNQYATVNTVSIDTSQYHTITAWTSETSTINVAIDGITRASFSSPDIYSQMTGAVDMNTGLTLSVGGGSSTKITFFNSAQIVSVNADSFSGSNDYEILNNAISSLTEKSIVSKASGQKIEYRLYLQPRTYNLSNTITFINANNIKVYGNGANLIYTNPVTAVYIEQSEGIEINDLTIDYNPLVCTQGVIQSISDSQVTVLIDTGYPADVDALNNTTGNDGLIWSNIHDRATGAVLADSQHSYAFSCNAVSLGNNRIQLTKVFPEPNGGHELTVGDAISLFHRGPTAVLIEKSEKLKFSSVNIYASPGFGISESNGKGGTVYSNVDIVPGPKPAGATQNRLRSANGDGTHFGNLEIGPTIDSCSITHCGDDCVNIQGFFYYVLESSGTQLVVSPKWDNELSIGETIEAYSSTSYATKGTAKITQFSKEYNPAYQSQIIAAYQNFDSTLANDTLIYRITLDKSLNISTGDHITSLNRIGSGAVITNSTFGYNRARGVVVKGRNTLIQGNHFYSLTHPAIIAAADIYWRESGFLEDLVIRNNTILNAATCSNMIYNQDYQIGAITVSVGPPLNTRGFYDNYNNQNILIEGNTISGTKVYGISATNCSGISIKNNAISGAFSSGRGSIGSLYSITPDSGIFVGKSYNVSVTNNTVLGNSIVTRAAEIHSSCSGTITNTGNILQ